MAVQSAFGALLISAVTFATHLPGMVNLPVPTYVPDSTPRSAVIVLLGIGMLGIERVIVTLAL